MPASKQISTRRLASATSVVPQARQNSLPPPKVPVPKLRIGTLSPEPPSCLCSMLFLFNKVACRTQLPLPQINSAAVWDRDVVLNARLDKLICSADLSRQRAVSLQKHVLGIQRDRILPDALD